MDAASIFSLGNTCILIGWILLIFLPNWKYTQASILNGLIVLFAVVYTYLILKDIGDFRADSFSSLANVKALFQNDNAVAAGWFHYLASSACAANSKDSGQTDLRMLLRRNIDTSDTCHLRPLKL